MRALIATLLITCATSGAAADETDRPALVLRRLADTHPRLLTAPVLPEPPGDLPGIPLRTPADARCSADGGDLGAGAWLPMAWSDYVHRKLEAGGMLPARFQAQLDELGALAVVAVDAESRVIVAEQAVERAKVQVPRGHPTWRVVLWVAGGVAAGAAAGMVVGYVAGR